MNEFILAIFTFKINNRDCFSIGCNTEFIVVDDDDDDELNEFIEPNSFQLVVPQTVINFLYCSIIIIIIIIDGWSQLNTEVEKKKEKSISTMIRYYIDMCVCVIWTFRLTNKKNWQFFCLFVCLLMFIFIFHFIFFCITIEWKKNPSI